jgi:peptide/nickel transport system substrate-binding protein
MSPNLVHPSGKVPAKVVVFSLLALFLVVLAACGQGGSSPSASKGNSILNIVPSPKGDFTNGFSP